jgi:ORF6N domain
MSKAKQNNNSLVSSELIVNKIYIIRGIKIMLDKDLAAMYGVETFRLNESVKRNIGRFPDDFMFQLTKEEFNNLISHFAISSWGGTRKMPYAFTEQGVAMLSGIINSERAIAMNIAIMRAFVAMRKIALTNKIIAEKLQKLEDKIGGHDVQLNQIYEAIENLLDDKVEKHSLPKNRKRIGFKPDDL